MESRKVTLVDGEFIHSDEFESVIFEEGRVSEDCWASFSVGDLELTVFYSREVFGNIYHDKGDYLNPPLTEVDIVSDKIYISRIESDLNIDEDTAEKIIKAYT